jgi:hypothetical protein
MPVERTSGGTVITGNAIRIYQLLAVIKVIEAEAKGMHLSKVRNVKAGWAKRLGLSPRAKAEVVIAKLREQIDKLKAEGV